MHACENSRSFQCLYFNVNTLLHLKTVFVVLPKMQRVSNLAAFFLIWSCGFCYAGIYNMKIFLVKFDTGVES